MPSTFAGLQICGGPETIQKTQEIYMPQKQPPHAETEAQRLPEWSPDGAKTSKKWDPDPDPEGYLKKNVQISNPYIICYVCSISRTPEKQTFRSLFGDQNEPRSPSRRDL